MAHHQLATTSGTRRPDGAANRPKELRTQGRAQAMNPLEIRGARVDLAHANAPCAAAHATLLATETERLVRGNTRIQAVPATSTHAVMLEVDDVDPAARQLGRRGLALEAADNSQRAVGFPLGITTFVPRPVTAADDDISGLDHLVFMCTGRDRALALFGATFGLDLRLDRAIAEDVHQLFFRASDLVFEVIANDGAPLDAADAVEGAVDEAPVSLWGLAWRSVDIERSHARLADAGMEVTEVRPGRKPATRIFTVSEPDLGTRTVVIGPA
ncbi:VOC family protein [Gordonia sp. NPDC003585]|uniref:VOC family protein n=2 Tax=unclassified Gordonia (in: high G+C Gram-positive bacteria) TaxID=2657482 RepID=UPI0033BB1A18